MYVHIYATNYTISISSSNLMDFSIGIFLKLKFILNCRRFRDKKDAAEPEADPERDQRTVFAYQVDLLASLVLFCFCFNYLRSDILGHCIIFWWFPMIYVMIADALKGNRKGCLWILLKSWQGQSFHITCSSVQSFM